MYVEDMRFELPLSYSFPNQKVRKREECANQKRGAHEGTKSGAQEVDSEYVEGQRKMRRMRGGEVVFSVYPWAHIVADKVPCVSILLCWHSAGNTPCSDTLVTI